MTGVQTCALPICLKTSVISINYDGENAELVTQDTIFFPTGGGQSCDRGTISFDGNTVEILNVYEKDDEVVHVISGSDAAILKDCALRSIGRIDGFEIKMILDPSEGCALAAGSVGVGVAVVGAWVGAGEQSCCGLDISLNVIIFLLFFHFCC